MPRKPMPKRADDVAPWKSFPLVPGMVCGECSGVVRSTPGGTSCANGHGGATTLPVEASPAKPPALAAPRRPDAARAVLVPFTGARLVQFDRLEELDDLAPGSLAGAIVKVAPTLLVSQRGDFDATAVAARVRAAGAVAVVVAPKVVADALLRSGAEEVVQQAVTPRDAVVAWFNELAGLTDEDRTDCIEMAHRAIDTSEGT